MQFLTAITKFLTSVVGAVFADILLYVVPCALVGGITGLIKWGLWGFALGLVGGVVLGFVLWMFARFLA